MAEDTRTALAEFVDGLDYPMFVVTTASPEERSGCLIGFATQVSLEPGRFLACLSQANHTHDVARAATHLGVHVLDPGQRELAEIFGGQTGDDVDKFSQCRWRPGPAGVPVLDDCPRAFVGRIVDVVPLGDHTGFLLEPEWVASREGDPGLTYQDVEDLEPGHPA